MVDYKRILKNQDLRLKILTLFAWVPDKTMLKIQYRIKTGKRLNLKDPKTFNEKIQWLKIYNRKDIYTKMVDKYDAKKYVANIIGKNCIIPTIGVYEKFDDIDFNKLPNQFVMKCTHDSGGVVICKNKKDFDYLGAKERINSRMKKNPYYYCREWPYKNVKPRIIIEKFMSDNNDGDLKDYKFFCFNSEPKVILVCSERSKNLKETWFDCDFNKLDILEGGHDNDNNLNKPKQLKEMIKYAKMLSKKLSFVRIDFYEINSKVYFGEITFFPASGFEKFEPEEWNEKMGSWINLNDKG